MKKILCLSACLFTGSVNAAIVNDFTGDYAVSNWGQSLNGGAVITAGAPNSIVEISSNDGSGPDNTDFTIASLGDGLVSFDWAYSTMDGPFWDSFGWLLNGSYTQLTNNSGSRIQNGSTAFSVLQGDVFGFRSHSRDSIFGSSSTTISNFSAPVPEPTSIALLALGLISISFSKKVKAA